MLEVAINITSTSSNIALLLISIPDRLAYRPPPS